MSWPLLILLAIAGAAREDVTGDEPPASASSRRGLAIPDGLPVYRIQARLDLPARKVIASEQVSFTNRTARPTSELVFHVYPRHKVDGADAALLSKTLEVLRLSPDEAFDREGRRLEIRAIRSGGRELRFDYDDHHDTILVVHLPSPIEPGSTVEADLDFELDLPDLWGRWGHHKGITYLLNWYPVLAVHDEGGWERTPFVPWHQPWHQEAGHYHVTFDLPADQIVASSGMIVGREPSGEDRQRIRIEAAPSRDFAFVCSDRFETLEARAGSTRVRVHCLPEHRENAEAILASATEVIPLYERWFGPYYDDEFEVAPSFFGWNGNESSGLVLIDDRVMKIPSAGRRYLDHLVTHETCHQWFWNVVGTNGYAETFMDEGLVNAFTAMRLDAKYGRNAPLIVWPRALGWLPTIGREDLRLSGYYGWRARGNGGSAIRDLDEIGNLNALFSLAYDRGGKVVEMIRNRLGQERFFAFFRKLYHDHAFRILSYEDLKRELDAFDPEGGWPGYLDHLLIEHRDTDWAVEHVKVGPSLAEGGRPVTITLRQRGDLDEPTVVLCRTSEGEIRVPIWPERGDYEVPGARVSRDQKSWTIALESLPSSPTQVIVDPDHALLDAVPDNNRWKPEVSWRLTPMMTPLDGSSQFQAYDRISLIAGPFIDQYARGGFKVGAQRLEKWQLTAWAGGEPSLSEAIFGGQAALLHFPWPNWSAGVFYEEGLYNFYNDVRHSGGRAFLRYRFLETSSFLVDDQGFAELYFGAGYEFWQGDDGRPVFDGALRAVGARYRLSTLFPYWDPVGGQLIEATAEYGSEAFGSSIDYVRASAEYGFVRSVPEGWGPFSKTRLAFRAYGGVSYPDRHPLFRLGGGRRLRALDLVTDTGNALWLMTLEWRFPLWREIDRDVLDHIVSARNLQGALFYDVGQSFLDGRANTVVHGLGLGLRLDAALFAFLERAALRLDLAVPVGTGRGPVLWFGLNQVF